MPDLHTFIYGQSDPAWLEVQRELTGIDRNAPRRTVPSLQLSTGANVQIALRDIYAGLLDDLEFRQSSDQRLIGAFLFRNGLFAAGSSSDAYMHPSTFNAFCDDLDTPVRTARA